MRCPSVPPRGAIEGYWQLLSGDAARRGERDGAESDTLAVRDEARAGAGEDAPPLGFAVAQLHGVYILSQTADGLVLVDMHAAHERVMYERMKQLLSGETAQQQLLVPEILNVTPAQAEAADAHGAEFAALGFALTRLAPDQLALRGVPSLLAGDDPADVVRDVLSDLAGDGPLAPCRGIDQPPPRHHGLSRGGARAAHSQQRGNERPAARDGAHRSGRSVQSRPPDLGAVVARGSRSAVHARALMAPVAQAQNSSPTTSDRRSALLLMGPTGAGKSELALELARRFPFEIVSVDSAQVYRGMDIGTAKPDLETRARIPHHLIDIRDPATSYSAGEFVRDASAAMHEIWSRGASRCWSAAPCCTSMRFSAGLAQLPEADPEVRAANRGAGGCRRLGGAARGAAARGSRGRGPNPRQ